jgi:hypothetical protein
LDGGGKSVGSFTVPLYTAVQEIDLGLVGGKERSVDWLLTAAGDVGCSRG